VFANHIPYLAVTQEFGTVPGILVARALILENAAYHTAPGSDQHVLARHMVKNAFNVPTKVRMARACVRVRVHVCKCDISHRVHPIVTQSVLVFGACVFASRCALAFENGVVNP
jgi:hypothetical protein